MYYFVKTISLKCNWKYCFCKI